jgi:phage gp46-like protein
METVRIEQWASVRDLVLMSVGTDKGRWWADPAFGSELWLLKQTGKVTRQSAGTVQRMLGECLQWLIDDGIAANIECTAEQSGSNGISYSVAVTKPDGDTVLIKDTWYGI